MKQPSWCYETDDGTVVYRASSLYSCIRSMVAARTGETAMGPHANLRAAMDASSGLESVLLNRVAAELRGELIWEQREVDLRIPLSEGFPEGLTPVGFPYVIVRGHIDAMHKDSDTIVEAKALGDTLYNQYIDGGLDAMGNLGMKYQWQMSTYGHATGRKVRIAVGHKVKLEDGTFAIDEVDISEPYDPESLVPLSDIIDRIRKVEECAAMDLLPDCDMSCTPSSPFSECHLFPETKQGGDELEALLSDYHDASEAIKRLTDHKDSIRDQLITQYGDGKHTAGSYLMNIIRVTSQRFDVKWLRKQHSEIYDQGLVPSESIRVNVTAPKGERDD